MNIAPEDSEEENDFTKSSEKKLVEVNKESTHNEEKYPSELDISGSNTYQLQNSVIISEGPLTKEQSKLVGCQPDSSLGSDHDMVDYHTDSSFEPDPEPIALIRKNMEDILNVNNSTEFDNMPSASDSENDSSFIVHKVKANPESLQPNAQNEPTEEQKTISSSSRVDVLDDSQALPPLVESDDHNAWKNELVDSNSLSLTSSGESPYVDHPYPPVSFAMRNTQLPISWFRVDQNSESLSNPTEQNGIMDLFNRFAFWVDRNF